MSRIGGKAADTLLRAMDKGNIAILRDAYGNPSDNRLQKVTQRTYRIELSDGWRTIPRWEARQIVAAYGVVPGATTSPCDSCGEETMQKRIVIGKKFNYYRWIHSECWHRDVVASSR